MVETPERSDSDIDSVQQDESGSTSNQGEAANNASQQSPVQVKRAQVSTACEPCRQRKVKCDALRPCTPCRRKGIPCRHETQRGETRSQAMRRRYDDIARAHETYAELFHMLRTRSQQASMEIFRLVRSGHSPDAILRLMQSGDITPVVSDVGRHTLETLLVNLAHSTGSLPDVIRLATLALKPSAKVELLNREDFLVLRNRIVHLPYLETLLQRLNYDESALLLDVVTGSKGKIARPGLRAQSNSSRTDDQTSIDNRPPHQVPAAPWTTVTANDEAVSHLVSLFLAWINPTWRFVEQDLFLLGMRSQRLLSDLCSPFLVNSICAIACLQSEHEIAFVRQDADRVTRGEHFHNEALRLWALERNRPTLPNMQALCILSLDSNYRAKDSLGLTLIPIAAQLNNEVAMYGEEKRCADQGISKGDFARARLATYWTVVCTHIIMRIAFMSAATAASRDSELPKIDDIFDDRVEDWVGYPFTKSAVAHSPTLYLRERCRLAELFQEMHTLIYASDDPKNGCIQDFARSIGDLFARMQEWYRHLPLALHYDWPMSPAVWELHASYHAFLMILCLVAKSRFQQKREPLDGEPPLTDTDDKDAAFRTRMAQKHLSDALPLAHKAAQMLFDFRERYGLKITPAWLLQLQAVAASVLLLDLETGNGTVVALSETEEIHRTIHDSGSAFDEVFRCLLGSGVEVMIARGIARMTYHTALEHKIDLSRSSRSMLQIMSDTAWRPSDLSLVNSTFPNFATPQGSEGAERMTEMLSKWEKLDI